MPLPSDEKLIQLGNDFIQPFDTIFGLHPGSRPAHGRGYTPIVWEAKMEILVQGR
jgi:hypothetical protein